MTRRQRRAHFWAWSALAVLLAVGLAASLIARTPPESGPSLTVPKVPR